MALWVVFAVGVIGALALDLGVFHRKAHTVRPREALVWSLVWFTLAILFAVGIFLRRGTEAGAQFLTGYLIELSLSVDNVFLFAILFSAFKVPLRYQHRVLFWGILSAVIMRGAMIVAGAALLNRFHWTIYLFGGLLIFTGIKMFVHRNAEVDITENAFLKWLRRHLPITNQYHGQSFLARVDGRRMVTPLFLVLALVEATDLMFALDSIPAIFAVTTDPFIVFTSNVFAILGLRSMYFLLADVIGRFRFLKVALAFILVFVGLKMMGAVELPILASLAVIAGALGVAIAASWLRPAPGTDHQSSSKTSLDVANL